MLPSISFTFFALSLSCQTAISQSAGPLQPQDVSHVNPGVDLETLPTYLVVASGSVPQITGTIPSVLAPVEITAEEAQQAAQQAKTPSAEDEESQMTEFTTTLITVADGSTFSSVLTPTVPVSVAKESTEEDEDTGSSSVALHASMHVLVPCAVLFMLLVDWKP